MTSASFDPTPRTIQTVADLTPKHLGKVIRIPDLQQPGLDFDAPRVTITGRYYGRAPVPGGWWRMDVRLRGGGVLQLDTPVPGNHPCYLTSEAPLPSGRVAVDVPLFGGEDR